MADHSCLGALLLERGCPPSVFRTISSLISEVVHSRVLANGQASLPYFRSRGIVQGSLISSILFNIYIDDHAHLLNTSSSPIFQGFFYAENGVLLANDLPTIQALGSGSGNSEVRKMPFVTANVNIKWRCSLSVYVIEFVLALLYIIDTQQSKVFCLL